MKSSRTLLQSLAVSALCAVSTLFAADAPKPAPAPAKPAAELETKTDWTPRYTINLGYDNVYKVHGEAFSEDPAFSMGMTMHVGDFFLRFRGSRAEEQSYREEKFNETSTEMFSDYDIALGYDWKLKDLPLVGDVTVTFMGSYQNISKAYSGALAHYLGWAFGDPIFVGALEGVQDFGWSQRHYESLKDSHHFYLTLAVSLDDVLLTPNASINWEPDGGVLWGQFGIKYDYVLDFISEKLTWGNTLDFYWFGEDFVDWTETVELREYYQAWLNGEYYGAGSRDVTNKWKPSKEAQKSMIATCTWRSTLSYAFNENTTISVYGGVDYYINEMIYVRDQFDSIWGAALTFSF